MLVQSRKCDDTAQGQKCCDDQAFTSPSGECGVVGLPAVRLLPRAQLANLADEQRGGLVGSVLIGAVHYAVLEAQEYVFPDGTSSIRPREQHAAGWLVATYTYTDLPAARVYRVGDVYRVIVDGEDEVAGPCFSPPTYVHVRRIMLQAGYVADTVEPAT